MQAVILAAGMGKRLKELTKNNTKCMVKVNGVTLIERMLHQIDRQHLSRIIIVVGYEGQKLIDYIGTLTIQTPIIFINNPIFDKTNNIYSLALAKDWLCADDTILLESDLIFDESILEALIADSRQTLAVVDQYESWMDGTCVKIGKDDSIQAIVSGKKFRFDERNEYYKTVNIHKFSRNFSNTHYVPFLVAYQAAMGENEYYEQVLRVITMLDDPEICAMRLEGQRWYEIDDVQDLDIAESLFSPDADDRVRRIQERYGGYWRYPKLLDFCYLVNPYYPPRKLRDELRASFDTLLTSYPSGMHVNSFLAAKNFGVRQECILVGNGAAELIKGMMSYLDGRTGFVRPTFEEYPNRYARENSVYYIPDNPDYAYTADDLMRYFADQDICNLVVINPDNPSGNFIPKKDLLRLIDWCAQKEIRLVIDESFVDFADEENATLISQETLTGNTHLYVIKSISKSYGVPGLRLGVLASGDTAFIAAMKKDVAIWNINSFAEFFMQIEEKYRNDYLAALTKLKAERRRFEAALSTIKGVRTIPSQANYVMVELDGDISPKELLKTLLIKHHLLIKELTAKTNGRSYLRLAIRDSADNDTLLKALRDELEAML